MADRDARGGIYGGTHTGQQGGGGRPVGEQVKGMIHDKSPTASQALTVATLFPLGGLLLVLSGLALAASVVGLAVATPVFLIFSPVLVPAALLIGMAVTGFLTSGALGLGGLSSLSCLANTARQAFQRTPDYSECRLSPGRRAKLVDIKNREDSVAANSFQMHARPSIKSKCFSFFQDNVWTKRNSVLRYDWAGIVQ
ncbi:hypothetical protein C2845_PM01G31490 [Panicum miliaceum]|uniref:Oleosin n=1 Tax=Panicum miliaceum TaxID=4540 RepID=A0A3L6TGD8_PANMI|nr:hypothetical protein C2845_PM01G31490 [Panicum miliaceum]